MNFYPFHLGDYTTATRHLSWDEDIAYRRLLDAYYSRELPIPADRPQAYRLVQAHSRAQKVAVDTVLDEFFDETPDGYRNARCDEVITHFQDKSSKASASANRRWGKQDGNANEHANAQNGAMPPHNKGNATNTNTNTNTNSKGGANAPLAAQRSETTQACVKAWNLLASENKLPEVQNITEPRIKALHARLPEIGGLEGWYVLIDRIRGSPHLLGRNDRGWRADFDWILKPANLTKIMEGNYLGQRPSNAIQDAIANLPGGLQERDYHS